MLNNFRVFEELVFFDLWIPDSGFLILVSGSPFRVPVPESGLRFPGIRVAPKIEWNVNDLLTVDDSNSVKFKTTFIGEYTTYLTLTERVNTFVMILPNEK